jgi:hypothetical protein
MVIIKYTHLLSGFFLISCELKLLVRLVSLCSHKRDHLFTCDICYQVHKGEQCEKRFTHLIKHILSHKDEKPNKKFFL